MKSIVKMFYLTAGILLMFSCKREGCMDSNAVNYDSKAKIEDGSCIYPENLSGKGPIAIDCDYFSVDRILKDHPDREVDYYIDCYANVQGELIIEPGVVIEFGEHGGFNVISGYNLFQIQGTAEKPIVLTGKEKVKGYWRGIFMSQAHNQSNLIEHSIIQYGASMNHTQYSPVYEGVIAIRGVSGTPPQALNLVNVEISNGGGVGLDYHSATKIETLTTSNLKITDNLGVPVKVSAEMAHIFDSSSSYSNNGSDFVNITTSNYDLEDQTVIWENLDVPYLIDGRVHLKSNAHLTIAAGTEMQFKSGGYLQVSSGSATNAPSLKLKGDATNKIYLKAFNGNNWGGIYYGFTKELNEIEYTVIENAKGDFPVGNITNTGAVYMHAEPLLNVSNTVFKNIPNCAFYGTSSTSFNDLTTSNVTFENVTDEYCTQ